MDAEREIYTVTALNRAVRTLLERNFNAVWVEGEISNLARPASGHIYFSLKDNAAQVRCAMFRTRNRTLGFAPNDGTQVIARARMSLYEPRGEYQLIIEHMEPAGEGLLRIKLEALKQKLAAEGLFDETNKLEMPSFPQQIGVVTSTTGAALRDVLTVLKRRCPAIPVVIYPTTVQGASAAPEIVRALATANSRAECSVLILARGGGSLEDLWAFNEEAVGRAIHRSRLPIVCGVGHEIDHTIADLAADLRAPTPSAAAELCTPDTDQLRATLMTNAARLHKAINHRLATLAQLTRECRRRLIDPKQRLEQQQQRVDDLLRRFSQALGVELRRRETRVLSLRDHLFARSPTHLIGGANAQVTRQAEKLHASMRRLISQQQARMSELTRTLHAVSPGASLDRGYAIIRDRDGVVARDAEHFSPGDPVSAHLARGKLELTVDAVNAVERDPSHEA